MELTTQPDIYSPSLDNCGNYIDSIPSFNIHKSGLYCPCGTRKDKIYDTNSKFAVHIKTKKHQRWLEELNLNKANFYIENIKNTEIIKSQKIIIGNLEKDSTNKSMTITILTNQICSLNKTNELNKDIENLLFIE